MADTSDGDMVEARVGVGVGYPCREAGAEAGASLELMLVFISVLLELGKCCCWEAWKLPSLLTLGGICSTPLPFDGTPLGRAFDGKSVVLTVKSKTGKIVGVRTYVAIKSRRYLMGRRS